MKKKKYIKLRFNKMGLTQWYWRVLHPGNFRLGENVQIGSFTVIDAMNGVEIENNVKIGFSCSIMSFSSIDEKWGKVILKKNCKIGSNTVIMPGITIGENAAVGANSLVNKDVPPSEVWVGSPAKFLKNLNTAKEQWKKLKKYEKDG